MRPGQNGKRPRRGRKPHNFTNRTFDSNGPDVKIRGTAAHIFEKYQALARDANASGDRVAAENYLQHAEHYFRIMNTFQTGPAPNHFNGRGQALPQGEGQQPAMGPPSPEESEGEDGDRGEMADDGDDAEDIRT